MCGSMKAYSEVCDVKQWWTQIIDMYFSTKFYKMLRVIFK